MSRRHHPPRLARRARAERLRRLDTNRVRNVRVFASGKMIETSAEPKGAA